MVILLDKNKRPLGYCTPARARKMTQAGRTCVHRYYPYVLIVQDRDARTMNLTHNYRIKIDPGAQHTGLTVIDDDRVVLFMQIEHRGEDVVDHKNTQRSSRHNRRNRETPYRRRKFSKKGQYDSPRPEGWLPPSQVSIENNVITWVNRLIRYLGQVDVSVEYVKFDTQKIQNPEIQGMEYQQGTLFGYEMKEYLKEKYHHTCQYCGGKTEDHRLEWEHMIPKSRGGSDSVNNATLACKTCNSLKNNLKPEEWLEEIRAKKRKSEMDETRIQCLENVIAGKINGKGLRYAAWAQSSRNRLINDLKEMAKSIEFSSGGRTAMNRHNLGLPKDHHLDALCIGKLIPENGYRYVNQPILMVKAMGRGTRLLGNINKCGIITTKFKDHKKRTPDGLQTGDIVHAVVPNGKYAGEYTGRIMVRSRGSHDIRTLKNKKFTMVKGSVITVRQRSDGYAYGWGNSPRS